MFNFASETILQNDSCKESKINRKAHVIILNKKRQDVSFYEQIESYKKGI